MALSILAYLAGALTIATPCIVPILPFLLARVDTPFRRGALPMLLGLAMSFAAVASLASFAGGWAVEANRGGRIAALLLMTLFGLTMLFPVLATRMTMPIVSVGAGLSSWAERRITIKRATAFSSMLLGVATGLVWAPCAGPVLGLILTGAALKGPGVATSLLLLAYGLGAASSLAAGLFLSGCLLAIFKRSARWGDGLRRILGAAVVAGVATIWFGLDTGVLTRWSSSSTNMLEQDLITAWGNGVIPRVSVAAHAASDPVLSGPLALVLGTTQWLNTRPLRPEDLRGKVILVNFWTYSCINCLRTLPHVRAWADTYKDRGLVVIGAHTPEFAFEKSVDNVRKALVSLGVDYPVAIDNDFRLWRAFDNAAWPALYFIGADGRVRHQVLGEGDYDQSEHLIQRLLTETNGAPVARGMATINSNGPQVAADLADLYSPETYIGFAQARNFISPGGVREDIPNLYRTPSTPRLNEWGLAGVWTISGEFATLDGTSGGITLRFHARDVHLVLAPGSLGHPIRFRVTLDGAPPGADHGTDVDAEGWGSVGDARLYQLVRQTEPVADRTVEIEFFDPGLRAYSFTFG
jgi:cytochrome c biogenesis protein CcdA/thiol-disulfide isomerase/thioredoxin